jgi:mannose-6-phosphate isomerase-like protein (cupin superfamily)/SAM-dependent methyltransferase
MNYLHSLPVLTSFETKGLFGFDFGPLRQKDLEILYVEVEKGHDTFMVSKRISRVYYVLSGSGYFTIADRRYDVSPGMLVEVPPNVEYSYSGKMKLIVVCRPRWFTGNDRHTKWNPDVVRSDLPLPLNGGSSRILGLCKTFAKLLIKAYLRLNQRLWPPDSFQSQGSLRSYGNLLHSLARIQGARAQAPSTFFLRNRPQLELIRRLAMRSANADTLRVAVLGCSTGAEAYSIAWSIRSVRPDMKLILHAVDISKRAVEFGKRGIYSITTSQVTDTNIFERMTETEIKEMFDRDADKVGVKSWIKEGISWYIGDVAEMDTLDALGPQDVVVANNFLCHMRPLMAERCLRNIARLVRPYGYLIVSGIDLDVRTKVAGDLGWRPVQELLEEIHEGDPCMKTFWPWHYGGLEPLNKKKKDWKLRYAAAFQVVPHEDKSAVDHNVSTAVRQANESSRVHDPHVHHAMVVAARV